MGAAAALARQHPPPTPLPRITRRASPTPSSYPCCLSLAPAATRGASLIAWAESEVEQARGNPDEEASVSSSPPPPPSLEKQAGTAFGFGGASDLKKKRRGKERASVIRRPPIEKPPLFYSSDGSGGAPAPQEQQNASESTFLLTWLGLGSLILVEGIALAASGFLPEEWDKFFVKYLYPSFTPTVFLFVGGTVVYGVLKYLQGEQRKQ